MSRILIQLKQNKWFNIYAIIKIINRSMNRTEIPETVQIWFMAKGTLSWNGEMMMFSVNGAGSTGYLYWKKTKF